MTMKPGRVFSFVVVAVTLMVGVFSAPVGVSGATSDNRLLEVPEKEVIKEVPIESTVDVDKIVGSQKLFKRASAEHIVQVYKIVETYVIKKVPADNTVQVNEVVEKDAIKEVPVEKTV